MTASSLPTEAKDLQEFIDTKLSSKLWRLNNLYTIEDKDGLKQIMRLNSAQMKVLTQYKHNRKIILKSRQQGISTLFLAYNLDSCIFGEGFSAGIQSYGQDESNKLQRRAELMWDEFPEEIKTLLGIKLTSNNQKGMAFSNRSILKIGNFRGDTLQSLHVSELGKIAAKFPDKAEELKKGAFQSVGKNNKITIESTAEGQSGLFYEMWKKAETKAKAQVELSPLDFQAIFLSWVHDHDCTLSYLQEITEEHQKYFDKVEDTLSIVLTDEQKWWYVAKKDELGSGFDQEYPYNSKVAFEQSLEGAYYQEEYKNLIIRDNIYDPNLLVYSAMDIGVNDPTAVVFFQVAPDGTPSIIGEYVNQGGGLEHFASVYKALSTEKGWVFGKTLVPHDIMVKEWVSAKTRWDAMRELGFNTVLVKKHRVNDGIEATRHMLKTIIVDASCEETITAIQMYRRKYDKKFNILLDAPEHDIYSHMADSLRYMAMGLRHGAISQYTVRSQIQRQKISNSFDI